MAAGLFLLISCGPENPFDGLDPDDTGVENPDGQEPEGPEDLVDPDRPGDEAPRPGDDDPDRPGDEAPRPGEGEGDEDQPGEGDDPGQDTPVIPEEVYYVKVAQDFADWSGDYLITYTDGNDVTVLNSYEDTKGYGKDISTSLTAEGIHSEDGDAYKAVVARSGNGYTVNVTGIGYIGLESGKNSLSATASMPSSDDYIWTFSYKSGGSVWINNAGHNGYRLQWK